MRRILALLFVAAALNGCGGATPYYAGERFGADTIHRRAFAAPAGRACEAARLALLADGYVVTQAPAGPATLVGAKAFREKEARRALLQVHVTCAPAAQGSVLYVTAVERHFEVKQTRESTSVGIPLVSPLSVTTSRESEGQVETSGETVESRRFYERFYAAVARELRAR